MKTDRAFLDKTLEFALDVSYEAGEILLKYQKKRAELEVVSKGSEGIASEADIKSEEYILGRISEEYPRPFYSV